MKAWYDYARAMDVDVVHVCMRFKIILFVKCIRYIGIKIYINGTNRISVHPITKLHLNMIKYIPIIH